MRKEVGLSLLEMIISLMIILFVTAFLSQRLFNTDLLLARGNASKIVDFINKVILDAEFQRKGFLLVIDHNSLLMEQYEFLRGNLLPCIEEYKLVCEFTEGFVPFLEEMKNELKFFKKSVDNRFKMIKSERIGFLAPQDVYYVLLIDPYKIEGDTTIQLNLKGGSVNIVVNPVLRFAKIT